MLEQGRARAAEAGVELDLREGDMRDLALDEPAALMYCPFRLAPAPTDLGLSAADLRARSPPRSGLAGGSPGTPSLSTTGSPRASMASIKTSLYRTWFGTQSAITGLTSSSTTVGRVPHRGQLRTSGSGSSMSPAFGWTRYMAASPASRSLTRAGERVHRPAPTVARRSSDDKRFAQCQLWAELGSAQTKGTIVAPVLSVE
jgi:hypothetical protein